MSKLSKLKNALLHGVKGKTIAGIGLIVADHVLMANGIALPSFTGQGYSFLTEMGMASAGVGVYAKLVRIEDGGRATKELLDEIKKPKVVK